MIGATTNVRNGPIALKNSVALQLGYKQTLARRSKTAYIERSLTGWTFDTANNVPKQLQRDFFNAIGHHRTFAKLKHVWWKLSPTWMSMKLRLPRDVVLPH